MGSGGSKRVRAWMRSGGSKRVRAGMRSGAGATAVCKGDRFTISITKRIYSTRKGNESLVIAEKKQTCQSKVAQSVIVFYVEQTLIQYLHLLL